MSLAPKYEIFGVLHAETENDVSLFLLKRVKLVYVSACTKTNENGVLIWWALGTLIGHGKLFSR